MATDKKGAQSAAIQTALDVINAKVDQLQPYFAHSQTRLVQVAKEYLRGLYEALDKVGGEQDRVQDQLAAVQAQMQHYQQVTATIQQAVDDPQLWPRQRHALQLQIDELTRQISAQTEQEGQLRTQRETAKNTVQSLHGQQDILHSSLQRQEDAIRQETDLVKITEMVAAQESRAADSNRQLAELAQKEQAAAAAVTDLTSQLTRMNDDLSAKISQRAVLVKQAHALSAKINAPVSIQDQLRDSQQHLTDLQDQIQGLEDGLVRLSRGEDRLTQTIGQVQKTMTSGLVDGAALTREAVQQVPTAVEAAPAPVNPSGAGPTPITNQAVTPAASTSPIPLTDEGALALNLPTTRPYLIVLTTLPTKLEPVLLQYLRALFQFLGAHRIQIRVLVTSYTANFVDRISRFLNEVGTQANVEFASLFDTLQGVGKAKPFAAKELPVTVPLKRGKDDPTIRSGTDAAVGDYRAYYRPDGTLNWIGYNVDAEHYLYDYFSPQHLLLYTQIIVHQRDVSEVTYYRRDRGPVLKLQYTKGTAAVQTFFNQATQDWPSMAAFIADWLSHDETARASTVVVPGDDPLCPEIIKGSLREQTIPLLSDRTLTDPNLGAKLSGVHWLLAPTRQDVDQIKQLAGWAIPVVTMDTLTSAEHVAKEQRNQ